MKTNLSKIVEVGSLDRRVAIQTATAATNEYHGETLTWATTSTVWARVDWQGGHETSEGAERKTAVSSVVFTIRYLTAAKGKKVRISYDSQLFDVVNVKELGRKRFLELHTKLFE